MNAADIEWPKRARTVEVEHRVVVDQRELDRMADAWREVVRLVSMAKHTLTGLSNPDHHVRATAHARRLLEEAGF